MTRSVLHIATLLVLAGRAAGQTPAPAPTPPTPAPIPASPGAPATEARPLFVITLNSGEILKGPLASAPDADPVLLEHAVFGKMSLARSLIKSMALEGAPPTSPVQPPPAPPTPAPPAPTPAAAPAPATPPAAAPAPAPAPPPAPAPAAPAAAPASPAPAPPPPPPPSAPAEYGIFDKWTGNVELGANSHSGNGDTLTARFGLGLRREVPDTVTAINTSYNYGRNNDGESENRAHFEGRNDWVQQTGSGWRFFVAGGGDYDEFQAWDWRVLLNGGVGYDIVKDKTLTLIGRAGFGGYREYGNLSRGVHAEVTPGMDLQWTIDERSKFTASFDYYHDLDDTRLYRFTARATYDFLIDPKSNLSLRLGLEDRYDESNLSPRVKNDIELYTALVFKF